MKNLYFNSIVNKLKQIVVLLVILFGFTATVNAQVRKAFTQRTSQYSPTRKIYSVKGDFTMLGNTCLTPQNYSATGNNNDAQMKFVDVDSDPNTFNSSSATLLIPTENGSTPECSNIIFAGLYWTGKSSSSLTFPVTKGSVTKTFDKRTVKLKGPNAAAYTNITIASSNDIWFPTNGNDDDIYSAYAEITDYVRTNGVGKYTVADMALLEGNPGGTGYSGGWGMIIVYENSKMKWRDVTIFDGYAYVEAGNSAAGIELPVSGFNTVQTGNVGMKIGIMASEGDVGYTGDYFKIRNLNTATYTALNHSGNSATNFFNSSINSGGTRTPSLVNNTGIDIATINLPNTNNSIIGNSQTSTKFLYGTNGDTYSIFNIAMSVDAYVPEVEATLAATAINSVPVTSQPYVSQPGQNVDFSVDIKNLGTEAVNSFRIVIPIPYNATYVAGSAVGTVLFTPLPTPNNIYFDASLGATGSIVWDFGTLPLPANSSTVLARLAFKLKTTTDCSILVNTACGNGLQALGFVSGVGAITNIKLVNKPFIEGYTQNGNCIGEPIPQPLDIVIDGLSYVQQNCANTPVIRSFSYCSASTSVGTSEIASFFPAGSLFYNQFPVTTNAIQYTDANPIPLVSGSTITYYAVPPNASAGCNFQFTISKCPAIIAQNDALAGGNGTTGNPNAGNVLNNNGSGPDTLNGVQATISQVNISVTTPAVSIGGAPVPVLNTTTGQVSVPAGTPAGTYTITYNLCEKLNPTTNCDPAVVTIIVTKPVIDAVNDAGAPIVGAAGGQSLANVLVNDTLNGNPATLATVNLTQVGTTASGVNLNPANGSVNVTPGTPSGNYVVTYQICEKLNPTNCDTATVTVSVTNAIIDAVNDAGAPIVGAAGGQSFPNVLVNDTVNGNPATLTTVNLTQVSTTNPGVTLNPANGSVNVAPGTPSGPYTVTYQICEKLNPTNCDTATVTVSVTNAVIDAVNDAGAPIVGATGGQSFPNVLVNDTLNGNPATLATVNLTQVSTTNPGVTLNPANGSVNVAPGTPSGPYVVTYQICEKLNPTNCDTATVTVSVTNAVIDAVNDTGAPIVGATGGQSFPNVLVNDTLNGNPATLATVNLTQVATTNAGVTLNPANGSVNVAPGTPTGNYTVTYQICEKLNPANCDSATVTVSVTNAVIDAVNDAGAPIIGLAGGQSFPNVLINDTLNGNPATLTTVNLTQVSTTNAGVTLNPANGSVNVAPGTPSGPYVVTYQICEKLNPTNCDTATVTVSVTSAIIDAVNDAGAPIVGAAGGQSFPNVLVNDTLNGNPATLTTVNLTQVSTTNPGVTLNPANGSVNVAPGTPSGPYTVTYQICEKLNPTNCDTATVTVSVTNAVIDAVNDAGAPIVGATGGQSFPNVLVNDTLNGNPATLATVNLTQVSTTNPGVTLNPANGSVNVAPGTPSGPYVVTYQICEKLNPTNCDTATVTVSVTNAVIDAVNDAGAPIVGATGGQSFPNVLVNDTLNGNPATLATVNLTQVATTNAGVTLNPANGSVNVAPGTPTGNYTVTYQICEKLNPANCDSATVTVSVTNAVIDAVNDAGAPIIGLAGGQSFPNVLINDTLNGNPATLTTVNLTQVSTTNAGVTLNPANGSVNVAPGTPSGPYVVTYQICEKLNPTNCDTATVTVSVTNAIIDAVNDAGAPIVGAAGGQSFPNVLVNDTLNGNPATLATVNLTQVSTTNPGVTLNPADGSVNVAPGTPSGPYVVTYQICEKLNPTNCDTATVTVSVTNAIIDAVNDAGAPIIGLAGGQSFPNVLINDTLNGNPATLATVNLIQISTTNAGVTLNAADGSVNVAPGTPSGPYTVTYQICEKLNPTNCDTAIVTVSVTNAAIIANDDAGAPINGITGGTTFTNVLVNDTLNGVPVLASQVNTTFVSSTNPGVTLSGTDVLVAPGTPSGSYTLVYQICEILNPTNCDNATVTVTVYVPSIELLKNGTYVDSLTPTGVSAGDTIIYNFTVTNTGSSVLTNVTVTDPLVNVVGGPIASLAVGAVDTTTFTATYTVTQADIDAGQVNNLATATGTPPAGPNVTDTSSDPTPCSICTPVPNCPTCTSTPLTPTPSIAITKRRNLPRYNCAVWCKRILVIL